MIPETKETQSWRTHVEQMVALARQNCPLPILQNILIVTIILHDAGKLSDDYQVWLNQIREKGIPLRNRSVDHMSAGGRIIERKVGDVLLTQMVATAVYSHHGLRDCIDMDMGETLSERYRRNTIDFATVENRFFERIGQNEFLQYLRAAHFDVQIMVKQIQDFLNRAGNRYGNIEFYIGMYERLLLSLLIDCDWTDTACFWRHESLPEAVSKEERIKIWAHVAHSFVSLTPEYAEQMKKSEKRLYRLTMPAGSKRFFSAFGFALHCAEKYGKKHIIYASSYHATTKYYAGIMREKIEDKSLILEWYSSLFCEDEEEYERYKKMLETWECPIVATTTKQILDLLFSSEKSSIRSMYHLCDSVILFDEVQALQVKEIELFHMAINFLTEFCDSTVVLCSSVPQSETCSLECNLYACEELIDNEEAYSSQSVKIEDRTEIIPGGMEIKDLAELAKTEVQRYGSVLVIVNTRSCAKQLYKMLRISCENKAELYHFSNSMCEENKKEELERLKASLNQQSVICVSTSLMETTMDLSFSCVIRSLAGMDHLIRSKERAKELFCIVKMSQKAENLERIEGLRRGQVVMEKCLYYFYKNPEAFGNAVDSKEMTAAYYRTYFQDMEPMACKYPSSIPGVTLEELLGKNRIGKNQYKRRYRRERKSFLNQAFFSAGDWYRKNSKKDSLHVIVPYNDEAEHAMSVLSQNDATLSAQRNAIWQLQKYQVVISEKMKCAVKEYEDTGLLVLDMNDYDKKTGVLDDADRKNQN